MAGNERFTRDDDSDVTPRSRAGVGEPLADDFRPLDLDSDDESAFLRGQRRVPVRRGALPKKTANRLKQVSLAVLAGGVLFTVGFSLYRYGAHSWRFRIESAGNIEITGAENVSRRQVLDVMASDIGRNVFFVPLEARQQQLEDIPWVESATVMRLLPDRLRVRIRERTPMAFVQLGARIALIDVHGVVMELPGKAQKKYSFPVIVGVGDPEPLSTRAARMQIYTALVRELDSDGSNYSQDFSEVDLSDPDDVKATVADPQGAVLLHLGSSDFLRRYKTYIAHAQEWRQQFNKLESVDLRYDRQIIVNPDAQAIAPQPAPKQAAPAPSTLSKPKTHGKRAAKPSRRD